MSVAVQTAVCRCSFGTAPTTINTLPKNVMISGRIGLNTTDRAPFINLISFGLCSAPTNPAVIAITILTLGAVKKAPCIPAVIASWISSKPTVLVNGASILNNNDFCMCMWLGKITISFPGQITVM